MTNLKTYSELCKLETFEERFSYLKVDGEIGVDTFGYLRYLCQQFYTSTEWRHIRDKTIARDLGCDLGIPGRAIYGFITIHHMNPITVEDVMNHSDLMTNPEYLICVSGLTHKAIHYGSLDTIPKKELVERKPNDTCPWKRG